MRKIPSSILRYVARIVIALRSAVDSRILDGIHVAIRDELYNRWFIADRDRATLCREFASTGCCPKTLVRR